MDGIARSWHNLALKSYKFPQVYHDQDARAFAINQATVEGYETDTLIPHIRDASFGHLYYIWVAGLIATNPSFLYQVIYLAFSSMGLIYTPFFFAVHLLDIALQNQVLFNVLRSVVHNGQQLLITLAFTCCIIYIYTVVAFNFFPMFFERDGRNMCSSMLDCFIFMINAVRLWHLCKGGITILFIIIIFITLSNIHGFRRFLSLLSAKFS